MIPGIFSRFLLHIYGTLRSAAYTYKAVNLRLMDDCRAWSKYWIVYAFLVCLDSTLDLLQTSEWCPLYEEIKLIFVTSIVLSAPNASVWIFNTIVHPFLSMPQVDEFLKHGIELFYSFIVLTVLWIIHWLRHTAGPVLFNVLVKHVCFLPGFQFIKKFMNKEITCEEKPPTDDKSNDLEDTEEEYIEANEFSQPSNNRNAASQVTFRHCPSVAQARRKFGDVLNDEPKKFDEEVVSMYRDSNLDDATIFTAKDMQRNARRFTPKT